MLGCHAVVGCPTPVEFHSSFYELKFPCHWHGLALLSGFCQVLYYYEPFFIVASCRPTYVKRSLSFWATLAEELLVPEINR